MFNPLAILAAVLFALAALGGAYWKGTDVQKNADTVAFQTERNKAAADQAKADADWKAKVKEQADKVADLEQTNRDAAAQFQIDLEAAKTVSAPITREVTRYVRTKPMDPVACAWPAELIGLRNQQIDAANSATYGVASPAAR